MSANLKAVESETPKLSADDRLKIRDLQYAQAKAVLTMRQLEAQYTTVKQQADEGGRQIEEAVQACAKSNDIDLTKWVLNGDSLEFVVRPEVEQPSTLG